MDIALFLLIIGVFIILIVMNRREKKIVMLSIVGCFVVTILGIVLLSGREESIQIVTNDNEIIEIRLDNKKEYYGHNFYRFSTYSSTEEILSSVQKDYSDACYDKESDKIVFVRFYSKR